MDYERTIREFLTFFWQDRCWQIEQTVLGAEISPRHPGEVLYSSALAESLRLLARAAEGKLDHQNEMMVGEVYETCQSLAEWLFAAPGMLAYDIPDRFADTPLGHLWWKALLWVQGDELITLAEAARIAGVSIPAISQRIGSGALRVYTDPDANERQGRRLVRRSDVTPN